MYLQAIQLENYRKFEFAQTDFPDGLVGIIGSNGAGKSSLMEAIAWALYGNEAARTGKNEIKRITAFPSAVCRVILDFQIEGDNFRVVRQLKGVTNAQDASVIINNQIAARGITATQDFIEKTLGMDYRAFTTSFYAPQKELNMLSDLQPFRRKEFLVRMLEIENIDNALKNLRTDKKEIEIKTDSAQIHLKDMDKLSSEKKEKEKQVREFDKEITIRKRELEEVSKSYKKADEEVGDWKKKFEEYNSLTKQQSIKSTERKGLILQLEQNKKKKEELLTLSSEIKTLKPKVDLYAEVKDKLKGLDEMKIKAEQKRFSEEQIKNLESSIRSDEKRLKEIGVKLMEGEEIHGRLNRLKEDLAQIEKGLEVERNAFVHLQTIYKALTGEKDKLKQQLAGIEELGPDSVCDRCLRPMGKDYERIREHLLRELKEREEKEKVLKEQKDESESKGKKIKDKKVKIEKEKETLQNIFEEFLRVKGEEENIKKTLEEKNENLSILKKEIEKIGEIKYDFEQHEGLKKDFEELEKIKERYTQIEQETRRLLELKKEIGDLRKRVEMLEKEEKELNKTIEELSFSEEEFKNKEKTMEEGKGKLHQLELNLKDILYQKGLERKEIERLENEIKESERIKKEIKDLSEKRLYLEELDLVFSDFRVSLIDRIKPTLSHYAKEFFVELTDGKYQDLELNEDYEIYIYDQGERFSIERFSGGEKDLANLCLRLAISLMISESSGVEFSFIILDEIFGSQDQFRKENILNSLAKLKNRFRQIFLITHIDDIKDSVENLITVIENEDGTSQLVLQ